MKFHAVSRCAAVLAGLSLFPFGFASTWAASPQLIAAAKKEGRVTWYTTAIVDQLVRPVASAFEKKYGVRVDFVRADSSELVLRIVNEAAAGHALADVFDGSTTVVALEKKGLVAKWVPDDAAALPKEAVDPAGFWVATNAYVLTPAVNTGLVPAGDEPKTFADLLDPRWKGKMVWAFSLSPSGAPGFIGLVLAAMGQDKGMAYLRKLSKQRVVSVNASARQVLNQVVAGEYPVGLQLFNDQVAVSAAQGAPVKWIAMNPALTQFSVAGLAKAAPHPAAGKLLIDYLISDEGQKLFREAKYLTVDPNVPPLDQSQKPDGKKFKAIAFSPDRIQAGMKSWVAIYDKLFR